jgi:ubiquinone/menaquinone biosynthesis C-methylase UbiE
MERVRGRFQGVANVFRFNWHFYLLAAVGAMIFFALGQYFDSTVSYIVGILVLAQAATSLSITFYVYDLSKLYSLDWLDKISVTPSGSFINLNAGFDESSELLQIRYPSAKISVYDFYDAATHTEVSIKRARKAEPLHTKKTKIDSSKIPLGDGDADAAFLFFSAHEIRNHDERVRFFAELRRVCTDDGRIVVTEHIRNFANLLAYNIGAFHFLPRSVWENTFEDAGLKVASEIKTTAFVTTFLLKKNGNPS